MQQGLCIFAGGEGGKVLADISVNHAIFFFMCCLVGSACFEGS